MSMSANNLDAAVGEGGMRQQVMALQRVLTDLSQVVQLLSDEQYGDQSSKALRGSVGGHVRHCLDHVRSLLEASTTGFLNYDRRERGTTEEDRKGVALAEIERLHDLLAAISGMPVDKPIEMRGVLGGDGACATVPSSIGREVMFVLSHTVHHSAMVGGLVRSMGITVPDHFGYAPSTLAYQRSQSCAQ